MARPEDPCRVSCWSQPAAVRSPPASTRKASGLEMEKGYIKVDDAIPDERAGHLGDWRRHHARRPRPSAAGARLVSRGHHRRGTNRRPGDAAAQLRPRAWLHLLRSRDRQRRPDRAEAKERGYDVRIGTFPFGVLGRAKMAGETEGFVKIVADKKYDEVLGVHMIGPRSTELVAEATVALAARIDGRRADAHHPRAPDDGRSRRRGGACAHGAAIHS